MTTLKLLPLLLLAPTLALAAPRAEVKTVSFMSYNVENLFDTSHDPGKEDWTYLPLAFKSKSPEVKAFCASQTNYVYKKECYNIDWTEEALSIKIRNMASVIMSANKGKGPDIVVMPEVENIYVLNRLAAALGPEYKTSVLLEGPDTRGIDVGILSKYTLVSSQLYTVDLMKAKLGSATRGILKAVFRVGQQTVTVFGCHFPSQGNSDDARALAAKVLVKAIKTSSTKSKVIAAGDFNTLETDSPNAVEMIGQSLMDVETMAREAGADPGEGSHYYQNKWSSLDHIFVGQGVTVLPKTVKFLKTSFNVDSNGNPIRFDFFKRIGYSDHLPVVMNFQI